MWMWVLGWIMDVMDVLGMFYSIIDITHPPNCKLKHFAKNKMNPLHMSSMKPFFASDVSIARCLYVLTPRLLCLGSKT